VQTVHVQTSQRSCNVLLATQLNMGFTQGRYGILEYTTRRRWEWINTKE